MAEGVRDIFALLHATIRKHGQQVQTVQLRNAWINVDPRDWKSRDHLTVNVGLGSGGKAQAFAQTMAIANVQKELLAGGKSHLVGDRELYHSAAELTRIMGHRNPDAFFRDPDARDPRTGQLLYPPPPPPPSPEAIKAQVALQIAQAKAEAERASAAQRAQLDQAKAQADALRQEIKAQAEIERARLKAELEARLAVLDAQLKAIAAGQGARHAEAKHKAAMAERALGMIATAQADDAERSAPPSEDKS
jgi:hypothetical protein